MDEKQSQILLSLRQITEEVAVQDSLESAVSLLVERIRKTTGADCCSLYLIDPFKRFLILTATVGLSKNAVGKASLKLGEGLVGYVGLTQKLVNLADARAHPSFKYLPDVGEDEFLSFLGVPVNHQGELLGVMVIQCKDRRQFGELEESFMVTLSAQIASIIAANNYLKASAEAEVKCFHGELGTGGIAIARALVWQPEISIEDVQLLHTDDPQMQLELFHQSLFQLQTEMDLTALDMREKAHTQAASGYISGYGSLLDDTEYQDEIDQEISGEGYTAVSAIKSVTGRRMEEARKAGNHDRYFDWRDVGQMLIARLLHTSAKYLDIRDNVVLVVNSLPAALVVELPRDKIVGFVCIDSSVSSHTSVLARDLGIPSVSGINVDLNEVNGRNIVVNGQKKEVLVDPPRSIVEEYRQLESQSRAQEGLFAAEKFEKGETQDHVRIKIKLNAGLSHDDREDIAAQTDGIGLYRTEIAFMLTSALPNEQTQTDWYAALLKQFRHHKVTMRTLDVGGDKYLTYMPVTESNPSLGWRGVRITIDQPQILRTQLRAMLRAQQLYGNLAIMIPMVSSMEEVQTVKKILLEVTAEVEEQTGKPVPKPDFGIMLEVPSVAYLMEDFAKEADFFSIGSNDLVQYLLAVDKSNPKVSRFYDHFHPAVLRCLKLLHDKAEECNRPIEVCGEAAGNPLGALLLLSLGYTALSMNYSGISRIKYIVRRVNTAELKEVAAQALKLSSSSAIRSLYVDYARKRGLGSIIALAGSERPSFMFKNSLKS